MTEVAAPAGPAGRGQADTVGGVCTDEVEDARTVILRLTTKGKRVLSTLSCDERDAFAAVYERIPAPDRTAVLEGLTVLASALDETDGSSARECCPPSAKPDARRA